MTSITKSFPRAAATPFKNIKKWVDHRLLELSSRSGRLGSLYYAFYSNAFDREHRAALYGRNLYTQEASRRQGSQYLLRRNVRRIEKGLLMRPRKEVFALEGYIVETVQRYQVALQNAGLSAPEELQWAHDVLQTYFSVVQSNQQAGSCPPHLRELRADRVVRPAACAIQA